MKQVGLKDGEMGRERERHAGDLLLGTPQSDHDGSLCTVYISLCGYYIMCSTDKSHLPAHLILFENADEKWGKFVLLSVTYISFTKSPYYRNCINSVSRVLKQGYASVEFIHAFVIRPSDQQFPCRNRYVAF